MLKEAGLNPGLMDGQAGSGGVTGSQAGGSAASGNANKTKGADTDKVKQDIAESEARIDEIIAKIPSEKQQYYIGKAHENGRNQNHDRHGA